MKRCPLIAAAALCLVVAPLAGATTHQASIGNYYYEDDAQHDRTKLVVRQGDQITFTVRQAAYPPHTVDVDELDIHSPDLIITDTYTTPVLNRAGNFYLYCRPHEARGHHTRLVVLAAPQTTTAPTSAPRTTAAPAVVGSTTPAPTGAPTPTATLTPVGVARATPGIASAGANSNPNSLEALTGHRTSNQAPWTSSLWWLLIATVPIAGAAVVALRRARIAEFQPRIENMRKIQAGPKTRARKPKPKR